MKINTDSNIYTLFYAIALVVVVAVGLTYTALSLQPLQEQNIKVEKMQNILQTILPADQITVENAEELYEKHIVEVFAVNAAGEKIVEGQTKKERKKVFELELKPQIKKEIKERTLPVYIAKMDDGSKKAIFPLQGKGLWGPIWGYLSLNEDYNTIYGAVFDHKGETPGLGAEINKTKFENQFKGKTIFEGKKLVSITVHKGGEGAALRAGNKEHGIDAISGGTITSKGLEGMVKNDWFFGFEQFLQKQRSE
ncbi:MAG: NADH:ubiquinone reductase (Na(+)-transporting) subunit C [Bacteroidota bacterium]|nr:NADH:ubiquinone reductase (Na(+)-transporting) subunit C [Bacteroidota bacterium]